MSDLLKHLIVIEAINDGLPATLRKIADAIEATRNGEKTAVRIRNAATLAEIDVPGQTTFFDGAVSCRLCGDVAELLNGLCADCTRNNAQESADITHELRAIGARRI